MTPAIRPAHEEAPRSRADQVTTALANSRDRLEAPFRYAETLGTIAPFVFHREQAPRPGSMQGHEAALRWLAGASDRESIEAGVVLMAQAYDAPPNREAAKLTLGLLLSAYPNAGKEPREEYFATLVHDVVDERIGPHVLAEACRKIRRGSRFLPTIGEVVSECGQVRMRLGWALEQARAQLEMRAACEAAVEAYALPPQDWSDEAWLEATMDWGRGRGWPPVLGPKPGEPDCLLPAHLKARYRSITGLDREAA